MINFTTEQFGKWLILAGFVGFTAAIVLSFTAYSGLDQGALPSISFLVIMLGMAFHFPTMLQESGGEVSTMRIIVFGLVMVFCVIYLKISWTVGNFEDFKIDETWIYILGLAFGSKVFQKFGEEKKENKSDNDDSKIAKSNNIGNKVDNKK